MSATTPPGADAAPTRTRVAVAPEPVPQWVHDAVHEAGAEEVPVEEAEALVWVAPGVVGELAQALAVAPNVRWVHLRYAGVEPFARRGMFHDGRLWTCGKGVFDEPVAEHVLALMLAGLRDLPVRVRATSWGQQSGRSLFDARITILGGGGIADEVARLLEPFRVRLTVVRRDPTAGFRVAARVVGPEAAVDAVRDADAVVVALALTPSTAGIVDRELLHAMPRHSWLVNVGRGEHVVTDDLVAALDAGEIGGAALDVTDPEPLPDGHPLWGRANVIITPHTANTYEMAIPYLAERLRENLRGFAAGRPLVGMVDPELGY